MILLSVRFSSTLPLLSPDQNANSEPDLSDEIIEALVEFWQVTWLYIHRYHHLADVRTIPRSNGRVRMPGPSLQTSEMRIWLCQLLNAPFQINHPSYVCTLV
jgi:hypothetical protein